MEYKLIFTDITALRPYIYAVGGALWGCVVTWLLINYVSDDLLLLASLFLYLGAAYVLILLVRIFYNQTVVIKYTGNEIILQIGRKEKRYKKQICQTFIVLIIYSKVELPFLSNLCSKIDIGRLDISDYTMKRSSNLIINEQKNSELKRFLMITISHFGFRPIKKVKWRTRTNICNVWYSK